MFYLRQISPSACYRGCAGSAACGACVECARGWPTDLAEMISGFVWTCPITVLRWRDGDTCVVDIDRGWRGWTTKEAIRLFGLWCPEMNQIGGPEAKAYAETLLPSQTVAILHSRTLQSLGRTLGDIRLSDGRDFASLMIAAGHGTATEKK